MKHAKLEEKIAVKLTAAERIMLLEVPQCFPPAFERLVENTPSSDPLLLPPDSLVAIGTYVGIAARSTSDRRRKTRLDAIHRKVLGLLADYRTAWEANARTAKNTAPPSTPAIIPAKKPARSKTPKSADHLCQLKITLRESYPPIWRRIQVNDCTLDKLHEHIQTAMGWSNSHLHHFKIGEQYYGDPMLMQESFDEMDYEDSTTTNLSDIIPKNAKKFRFVYEYDFGDSWYHEIVVEGWREEAW